MNNFINVRLQAYNHVKQLNILKHNTRKIQSLSEQDKSKTNYIVLNDGELFDIEEDFAKDTFYNTLKKFYNNDRKEHNEKVYKRRQRNLTTQQATWIEGVFTFSEAIHHDLGNKYTKEELSRVAASCAEDLAKQIGSKLTYMVFHLDETTPHFHLALKNFDDNGHSIFHKIKHKDILSKIQDIAFKHFGKLGMDRGINKEITGKNYQNITNYYKQQQIELKAIIQSLQVEVKQIQSTKKDILNDLNLTKSEKKDELDKLDLNLKSLRDTISEYKDINKENEAKLKLKMEELKTLNNDINVANDTLIGLNKQITTKEVEINKFNDIDKNIDKMVEKMIDNLVENPIGLLGKDAILKIDTLKDKTKEQLRRAFKTNIISKEFNILKEENQDLKSKLEEKDKIIENKDSVIEKVSTEKYQERSKNKTLEQDNLSRTNEMTKLEENHKLEINRLRNDFKRQVAIRVKRLNLINRLKRSNIANKVRLRLSKRKENYDLSR